MNRKINLLLVLFSFTLTLSVVSSQAAPFDGYTWSKEISYPIDIVASGSTIVGDYMYIIGGGSSTDPDWATNRVHFTKINADGTLNGWVETNPLPDQRFFYVDAAASYDNYIYVIGGGCGAHPQEVNTVFIGKVESDGHVSWTTSPNNLPTQVMSNVVVAWNNHLYSIGGWTGYTWLTTVYVADINPHDGSISNWHATGSLPQQRGHDQAGVVYDGKIYLSGGQYPSNVLHNEIFIGHIDSAGEVSWVTSSVTLPDNIGDHDVTICNDNLVMIGGFKLPKEYLTGVYYFPINNDGSLSPWIQTGSILSREVSRMAETVNNRIYTVGGKREDNQLVHSVYKFSSTRATNPTIEQLILPYQVYEGKDSVPISVDMKNWRTQDVRVHVSLEILGPDPADKVQWHDEIHEDFTIEKESSQTWNEKWIVPEKAPSGIYFIKVRLSIDTKVIDEMLSNDPAFIIDQDESYIQVEKWGNWPDLLGTHRVLYLHIAEKDIESSKVKEFQRLVNLIKAFEMVYSPEPENLVGVARDALINIIALEDAWDQEIKINEYGEYDLQVIQILTEEEAELLGGAPLDWVYLFEAKPFPIEKDDVNPLFKLPVPVVIEYLESEVPNYFPLYQLGEVGEALHEESIAAAITVEKRETEIIADLDILVPYVDVVTTFSEDKIEIEISSDVDKGKTFVVKIDEDVLDFSDASEIYVFFDGERISLADNYEDILNPNDDSGLSEYLVVQGSGGVQVLVSIAGFSTHTITITTSVPSFEIIVEDEDQNRLNGVEVVSKSRPSDQTSLSGDTGSDGVVIFENIQLGDYTFSVSKSGYIGGTVSGKVESGETTSLTISLEKEASGGIPGFPIQSLALGLILVSVLMLMKRKRYFASVFL
ncbi:hypothetical protein ACFL0D_06465 [Thermoproteota archaeon]